MFESSVRKSPIDRLTHLGGRLHPEDAPSSYAGSPTPSSAQQKAALSLLRSINTRIARRASELVVVATRELALAAAVRQLANEAQKPCLIINSRSLAAGLETLRSLGVVRADSWVESEPRRCTILGVETTDALAQYGLLFATSGSTGLPKLVPFRNAQVEFVTAAIANRLQYNSADVVGCAMYPFFDYGFYQADLAARVGATVSQFEGLRFPATALEHIRDDHVTVLPVTPAYAKKLVTVAEALSANFPGVRMVTNTGGRLSSSIRLRLESVFPNAVVRTMYGLTECKRVSVSTEADAAVRSSHSGTPLDGTFVTIRDADGNALPRGTVGELWVAGPHVTDGYIGGPTTDGLLRTGDMAMLDEGGRIVHAGRLAVDHIKVHDERIGVAAIEDAALDVLPADTLVLVAPSSDQDGITTKITVYVTATTASSGEVARSVRRQLGSRVARLLDVVPGARLDLCDNGKVKLLYDN